MRGAGMCHTWQDTGKCAKMSQGQCSYQHPKEQAGSNKGKDSKGGKGAAKGGGAGVGGKASSPVSPPGQAQKGSPPGQKQQVGKPGSASKRSISTGKSTLCKLYLQGKCTAGKNCTLHHNDRCKFNKRGECSKGMDCPLPHWNAMPATMDLPVGAAPAAIRPRRKAKQRQALAKVLPRKGRLRGGDGDNS